MEKEFQPFNKIARLSREIVVTEKIDGTNAQIHIEALDGYPGEDALFQKDGLAMWAGSRTRWITTSDDNFGFAKWALEHAEELLELGPGTHFGEWWGKGIQRGYAQDVKKFSLFNTSRWAENRPACCGVVPELYRGIFSTNVTEQCILDLKRGGSVAAGGYMNPEGIVVFHTAANTLFKKTIEKDESPKGKE